MKQLILLITLALATACSTRVVYERPRAAASPDAVDINIASVDELEKLPHIGRKTAEGVVEYRTTNGPFRRVENILLIRGMSESRFNELRPYIRVTDE